MGASSAAGDERSAGLERLVYFSDAVFAIVITLLVLPLAAEAELPEADAAPGDRFPAVFYAASMSVTSASLTATWLHVLRAGLVDQGLDRRVARYLTTRALLTSGLVLASVGIAHVLGLGGGIVCWVVLLPAVRVLLARRHRRSLPEPAGQSRATRSR